MDKELARHVAIATFRSMSDLQQLIPLLKTHCSPEEYEAYLKGIASVSAAASTALLNKVFADHPEIEQEVEAKIAKYGKVI